MEQLECIDLVERVTDYLEGLLDADVREQLREHLEVCWACERYVGEMSVTLQLLSALPSENLSDELASKLLGLYRKWAAEVSA